MPVADGQPVDAATTNPAFLDGQVDDYALGRIGFRNTLPASGFWVESAQRFLNQIAQVIGLDYTANFTAEADATGRDYNSTSDAVTNGDTTKSAIKKLSDKFAATFALGSHTHDGTSGEGDKIAFANLTGVRSGSSAVTIGADTVVVTFSSPFSSANYGIGHAIKNTTDAFPIFLSGIVTAQSTTGFTMRFNAPVDTSNYFLSWIATENV